MDKSSYIFIATLLIILANVFWYSAKFFIRDNGLKADMLWNHLRDFQELRKLMKNDYSEEVNFKAKLYFFGIPVAAVAALFLFFVIAGNNV